MKNRSRVLLWATSAIIVILRKVVRKKCGKEKGEKQRGCGCRE